VLLADDRKRDIRLLLTRAEEGGFIGAIAACKIGTIPPRARLIALENSRSFAESPIGGGPIVRVGDATSTFDPDLTYRCGKIAQQLASADPSFKYQRKLMPGGTCEASAYQAYGYTATCLCLPLGNYHNMNQTTGRIDSEHISLTDYDGLVRLLVAIDRGLDDPSLALPLRDRLDELFAHRRSVL
jgi:endoglucanase